MVIFDTTYRSRYNSNTIIKFKNMTDREFFIATLNDELPRFERVLRAVPTDKLDWRPHDKSKSAKEMLLDIFVGEVNSFPVFMTTGKIDFASTPKPTFSSIEDIVKNIQEIFAQTESIASNMSDDDWKSPAAMMMGDKPVWESTKGGMALALLLDLIHHRGQLSVYLRPMGGKVPAIYGPSADSQE
jgi:uncharacterized damage-inducible protein DinB